MKLKFESLINNPLVPRAFSDSMKEHKRSSKFDSEGMSELHTNLLQQRLQ